MARSSAEGIRKLDQTILDIVDKEEIGDQQTFLDRLAEYDFHINQSTLSRHLRKLGIRKQHGVYCTIELESAGQVNHNLVLEVVESPPNLLLVKTLPGHANAVGYYVETNDVHGVAGTVAGNDTLMVALSDPEQLDAVREKIVGLFKLEDRKQG